jgi:sialic acid synthase SpsE
VSLSLGDRPVGGSAPALLVAEIGSNHDGDLARALALIDDAAAAGADAVQFHSFRASCLAAARNGNGATVELRAHWQRTELRSEWHAVLRDRAVARGLVFLSIPFDEQRAALLAALGVVGVPVAAASWTVPSLLRLIGGFGRPILLGSGPAANGEIDRALAAIGEGAGAPPRRPPVVLVTGAGPAADGGDLGAVGRLDVRYDCPVGWTDRQPGHVLVLGAVARGASVVVKAFTDDRTRRGPTHATALDPPAFRAMATAVRELEAALAGGRGRAGGDPSANGSRRRARMVWRPKSES